MKKTTIKAIVCIAATLAVGSVTAKGKMYVDPSPSFGSQADVVSGKAVHSMELFRTAWRLLAQQRGWDDEVTNERASIFSSEWQSNPSFRIEAVRKFEAEQRNNTRERQAR